MEDNSNMIESLIERTADYGKTSLELVKLKALDKASDVFSTLVPLWIALFFMILFLLFLSVGLALWCGNILGQIWFGFFVVAGIYGLTAILAYLVLHKWIKSLVSNAVIKLVLK